MEVRPSSGARFSVTPGRYSARGRAGGRIPETLTPGATCSTTSTIAGASSSTGDELAPDREDDRIGQ